MIKNEKQYNISKKLVKELNNEIENINNNDTDKHPLRNQVLTTSLEIARNDIEKEILDYENFKKNKKRTLKERLIAELPSILTEYKIITGLTQKEFAQQLGVKEQQLQRYEATNFKSVTFKTLLRFFEIIGLEIRVKETRFINTNKSKSTGKIQFEN